MWISVYGRSRGEYGKQLEAEARLGPVHSVQACQGCKRDILHQIQFWHRSRPAVPATSHINTYPSSSRPPAASHSVQILPHLQHFLLFYLSLVFSRFNTRLSSPLLFFAPLPPRSVSFDPHPRELPSLNFNLSLLECVRTSAIRQKCCELCEPQHALCICDLCSPSSTKPRYCLCLSICNMFAHMPTRSSRFLRWPSPSQKEP